MFCTIRYPLYNFKNVKNTHGGVLLLVKLQSSTKLLKASQCKILTYTPWIPIITRKLVKKVFQFNTEINTSNHVFGRAIWDKLPKCTFENFEIAQVKRGHFQNFQNSRGWFIPNIRPNQTSDYWLITPSQ